MKEHLGEKLDAYLDGAIDAPGRREVEQHVKTCPDCRKELTMFETMSEKISHAAPDPASGDFKSYWGRLLGRHGEVKTLTAIQRAKRVVESNIHAAIDAMEEPSKMIRQLVREMRRALDEAREETVSAIALRNRLEARLKETEAEAQTWESRAEAALAQNRDDLARRAVEQALDAASAAAELKNEYVAQRRRVNDIKDAYARLTAQHEQVKRRQRTWLAQLSARQDGPSKTNSRAAYEELMRIVGATDDAQARRDAAQEAELIENPDETFLEMDRARAIDIKLADLRGRTKE
jgi:phage shock protein A